MVSISTIYHLYGKKRGDNMTVNEIQRIRLFLFNHYFEKSGKVDYAERATRLCMLEMFGIII